MTNKLKPTDSKRPSQRVRRNRTLLVSSAAVLALAAGPGHEVVSNVANTVANGGSEVPALDTEYIVQAGDTVDNISAHSGAQDSNSRFELDKAIGKEIAKQNQDQLIAGMSILVPKAYVQYVSDQQNQDRQ